MLKRDLINMKNVQKEIFYIKKEQNGAAEHGINRTHTSQNKCEFQTSALL